MKHEITVIDYGVGNLFSVCSALEFVGATYTLTADTDKIANAGKLLLPGVGAFGDAMAMLCQSGLNEAILFATKKGSMLLGICLGMQLLMDSSEEFGLHKGLGLIPGTVIPIPKHQTSGLPLKIPHVGWNELVYSEDLKSWESSILDPIVPNTSMYFVHSFMVSPRDPTMRLADCTYGDIRIASVIGRDNIWGMQFHPEKSGSDGLSLLEQYMRLS